VNYSYHPQYHQYAYPYYYDGHYPAPLVGWGSPDPAQPEAPSFGNWKDILIGAAIGVAGILLLRRVL
jgi:hypothetical protein